MFALDKSKTQRLSHGLKAAGGKGLRVSLHLPRKKMFITLVSFTSSWAKVTLKRSEKFKEFVISPSRWAWKKTFLRFRLDLGILSNGFILDLKKGSIVDLWMAEECTYIYLERKYSWPWSRLPRATLSLLSASFIVGLNRSYPHVCSGLIQNSTPLTWFIDWIHIR